MADLRRNNQDVWVCRILYDVELRDDNGDLSGNYRNVISNPKKYRLNVSATIGDVNFTPYGTNLRYSREISTRKKNIEINEGDLLFIDVEPKLDSDGSLKLKRDGSDYTTPPDYIVKAKIHSKKEKYIRYGLEKR